MRSSLGIRLLFRRPAQQIIDAAIIVVRQLVQGTDGNVQLAQLIVGIGRLVDLQQLRQGGLLQVMVFPEIPQSVSVHNITLG